jgi:hypothetical protein
MSTPWSREYVQEILNRENPSEAVFALAEIWSSRQGSTESDPFFGLLPCEFAAHLYLNYLREVGNGGHAQFFLNPGGAYAGETLDALVELGFNEVHDILRRAISVFPASRVPKAEHERERLIERFPSTVLTSWGRLDRELWAISGNYWKRLLEYFRAREVEILDWECS